MFLRKFFSSLTIRLQATAVFLSLVGVAFGYKTYLHVKQEFGVDSAATFYNDFLLQIGIAVVVNIVVALVLYQITTKPIKRLGEVMRALTQNQLEAEVPYVTQATEIGSMARKVEVFKKMRLKNSRLRLSLR